MRRYLYYSALWALILTTISACGPATTPVKNTPPPTKPTAAAENYLANQNYLAAAEEFWQLSSQSENATESERFAMRAALAYVDAAHFDQAAAIISETTITDSVATRLANLASAAIGEKSPQYVYSPNDVLTKLQSIEARTLTPYQKGVYHRTLGRAYYHLADFDRAAQAFNSALRYPQPQAEVPELHQSLWQAIGQLDDSQRSALIENGNKNLIGWLALKDSTDNVLHDAASLNNAISNWRTQFPTHPANDFVVEQLFEISESLSRKASHIALLLPLEGRYKHAAEAIRNGFLSAWFADQSTNKPTVSVYSVNNENVTQIYQNAKESGADFFVGPLEKQTIETLLLSVKMAVPIFVLNELDDTSLAQISTNPDLDFAPERVYHFGLSPEDEANSIARHIWRLGHRRVAAIAPESTLGNRLLESFSAEWEALGGTLLEQVEYSGDQGRYASAVRQAFNLDFSTARAKQLISTINRAVIHQPRPRKDIDSVFIGGLPVDNRQLIPQMRYFGVADVPMYASSHTFSGQIDPGKDIDLNGANFGDMPLILETDTQNVNYRQFRSNWQNLGPQATRMYAFGLDAYAMTNNAAKLRYQNDTYYSGATGLLSVDRSGKIVRDLAFAKFIDGVPVLDRRSY